MLESNNDIKLGIELAVNGIKIIKELLVMSVKRKDILKCLHRVGDARLL